MKYVSILLATLLFTSTAGAEEVAVFRYSDAELASTEGIADTHRRIEAAAKSFCREHLRGTYGVARQSRCLAAVIDDIVSSIDDDRLTAFATTGAVPSELLARR